MFIVLITPLCLVSLRFLLLCLTGGKQTREGDLIVFNLRVMLKDPFHLKIRRGNKHCELVLCQRNVIKT